MRDRQNHNNRRVLRGALDREHDHARAILAPFFPPCFVLVMPQIGIGYDETRLRCGERHTISLFPLKHRIEMCMPFVHA